MLPGSTEQPSQECEPTLEAREAAAHAIIQRWEAEAKQLGQEHAARLVSPYGDLDIIRGHGTMARELSGQADEPTLP
jgi:threonine dehydratase